MIENAIIEGQKIDKIVKMTVAVVKLIDLIHSEVLNKFGVDLYLEQEIIEWR